MIRERILAYGTPGSSKSYQWLLTARWQVPKGHRFFILDTDDATERMLAEEFKDLQGKLNLYRVYNWADYMDAARESVKAAREGDWVVVDLADDAWKTVQRFYIEEIFKEDPGQYFVQARLALKQKEESTKKAAKNFQPFRGWVDWPVVNALYDDWINPIIYRSKAHVYLATRANRTSIEDDTDIKETYGPYGIRPAGQKNLAHQVHTVFIVNQAKPGQWEITTVKDRGRKMYSHAPLISLPKQYLAGVMK